MKGSTALLLAVIGLVAILDLAHGVEEMTCKEFVGGLTKRQLGGISECSKKLGLKSAKEKKEKMNCVLKCVMIKEKLLNEEGLFDDASFDAFLAREMPPNLLEKGGGLFKNCKESTGKLIDPKEEYCKTYDVLIKCFLGVIGELCKS